MTYALPILFAVFAWWFSTGLILWLINRPRRDHAVIGGVVTVAMLAATTATLFIRSETEPLFAYLGFFLGLVAWGWHETLFLLGFVSGPRKTPCPPGLSTRQRFWVSTETILHHEVSIAVHAVVLALISIGADNIVAALTFFVLWAMRISAKLLVFFGAPNIPEHFLPNQLRYLGSYFRRTQSRRAALASLGITTAMAVSMGFMVADAVPGAFPHTVLLLLTSLVVLAVIEHLALVVRIPDQALWSWAIRPSAHTNNPEIVTGRSVS